MGGANAAQRQTDGQAEARMRHRGEGERYHALVGQKTALATVLTMSFKGTVRRGGPAGHDAQRATCERHKG
jgi:hypothetical protein